MKSRMPKCQRSRANQVDHLKPAMRRRDWKQPRKEVTHEVACGWWSPPRWNQHQVGREKGQWYGDGPVWHSPKHQLITITGGDPCFAKIKADRYPSPFPAVVIESRMHQPHEAARLASRGYSPRRVHAQSRMSKSLGWTPHQAILPLSRPLFTCRPLCSVQLFLRFFLTRR